MTIKYGSKSTSTDRTFGIVDEYLYTKLKKKKTHNLCEILIRNYDASDSIISQVDQTTQWK